MNQNDWVSVALGTLGTMCLMMFFMADFTNAVDSRGCMKSGCTSNASRQCVGGCSGEASCQCGKDPNEIAGCDCRI